MKVLHGSGKPRLVYETSTVAVDLGTASKVGDFYINFWRSTSLTDAIVNKGLFGLNSSGEVTWTRITSVSGSTVNHTGYSNGLPVKTENFSYKYDVYDLPYCQNNLIETFTPDFITHRLYNGTISTTIRGWWYSVILDYSRRITADQANVFASLFDKDRTANVVLYPRLDNLNFGYSVELDPETELTLAQKPFHRANKLFKIKLNGITRLDEVPLSIDYGKLVTEDGDPITAGDDYIGVSL